MSAPSQSRVQPPVRSHSALLYPCERLGCRRYFKTLGGRTRHINATHPILSPPPTQQHHPSQDSPKPSSHSQSLPPVNTNPAANNGNAADGDPPHGEDQTGLNRWDREEFDPPNYHSPTPSDDHGPQEPPADPNVRFFGPGDKLYPRPCNECGEFLTPGTPPLVNVNNPDDWSPYQDQLQFETAEFLFARCQMSAPKIDVLLDLWASTLYPYKAKPPFADHRHMYKTIDATAIGDVKWQSFSASYTGEIPAVDPPPWMLEKYVVWFRDPRQVVHKVLGNLSFTNEMDLSPFEEYSTEDQIRHYKDFMSGEWAWQQARQDNRVVATGNNEYYPLYLSIEMYGTMLGVLIEMRLSSSASGDTKTFLAELINHLSDKGTCFRRCLPQVPRQLFHSSLSAILQPLKPAMTMPEVVKFRDGHFRRVIYGLGPPRHASCGWVCKMSASRNNLDEDALDRLVHFSMKRSLKRAPSTILWREYGIVGDLVLIKGCFKDHLVDWVTAYIHANQLEEEADRILDDIDCRIAAAPIYGTTTFPQGREAFKQTWYR
ncbi:hypothetical protein BU15DRAFT_68170 [Melanogaster broomeanus]|nr:hypothetical protein BU15DRAFT_68170 [Melanogaster broomeanus]